MTTTAAPRIATPRSPTGTQRLRHLAVRVGVEPNELAHRMHRAECVSCRASLTYARRYFDRQHACEACAPGLGADVIAALREAEAYI